MADDFSAHGAVQAAMDEHQVADTPAPASRPDPDPGTDPLSSIIHNAYDEAQNSATVREYQENYHTVAGSQEREAQRAEARGDRADFGGELNGLADKFGGYLSARGATLPQAVERLMTYDHAIHSAPPEARAALVSELVASYGVSPEEVATMTPEAAEYAVAGYRENLAQMHNQANFEGAQSAVDQAKTAKNKDGSAQYPFFSELEPEMARLAQADTMLGGAMPSIDSLYKRAAAGNRRIEGRMASIEAEKEYLAEERNRQSRAPRRQDHPSLAAAALPLLSRLRRSRPWAIWWPKLWQFTARNHTTLVRKPQHHVSCSTWV